MALQKLITKTNELFYAGAAVVTNRLGVNINRAAERKEPLWRKRLQNKIKELRKDLSQLESSRIKKLVIYLANTGKTLERKYSIRVKTLGVVIKQLSRGLLLLQQKLGGIKTG